MFRGLALAGLLVGWMIGFLITASIPVVIRSTGLLAVIEFIDDMGCRRP